MSRRAFACETQRGGERRGCERPFASAVGEKEWRTASAPVSRHPRIPSAQPRVGEGGGGGGGGGGRRKAPSRRPSLDGCSTGCVGPAMAHAASLLAHMDSEKKSRVAAAAHRVHHARRRFCPCAAKQSRHRGKTATCSQPPPLSLCESSVIRVSRRKILGQRWPVHWISPCVRASVAP